MNSLEVVDGLFVRVEGDNGIHDQLGGGSLLDSAQGRVFPAETNI